VSLDSIRITSTYQFEYLQYAKALLYFKVEVSRDVVFITAHRSYDGYFDIIAQFDRTLLRETESFRPFSNVFNQKLPYPLNQNPYFEYKYPRFSEDNVFSFIHSEFQEWKKWAEFEALKEHGYNSYVVVLNFTIDNGEKVEIKYSLGSSPGFWNFISGAHKIRDATYTVTTGNGTTKEFDNLNDFLFYAGRSCGGDDSIIAGLYAIARENADQVYWEDNTSNKSYPNSGFFTRTVLFGNDGDDHLSGGWLKGNYIDGGRGNDILLGGSNDDVLLGGEGHDKLFGGEGDDVLVGGSGKDRLYGGPDNDKLFGGEGNDSLYGDEGNDTLDGGAGYNYLWGDGLSFKGKPTDTDSFVLNENGFAVIMDFKVGYDSIILKSMDLARIELVYENGLTNLFYTSRTKSGEVVRKYIAALESCHVQSLKDLNIKTIGPLPAPELLPIKPPEKPPEKPPIKPRDDDDDAADIASAYDNPFVATTYALDLHHDISMIEGW